MDTLIVAITLIQQNWDVLINTITGLVTLAAVIAKITPTEVDNNLLGKFIILMDKLGLNNKPTKIKK